MRAVLKSIEPRILRKALHTVYNAPQRAAAIILVVESQGQVPGLQIEVLSHAIVAPLKEAVEIGAIEENSRQRGPRGPRTIQPKRSQRICQRNNRFLIECDILRIFRLLHHSHLALLRTGTQMSDVGSNSLADRLRSG
ncbi:unnamed protein product [Chrysodeixis includens]|uniref:Uncharacterized protein n=1 Tax=Chrysodeixis includens TaxID=689277 RepID=A0A9N8L005_CHRIL|nr:unnamed protein product [Chrysodeixis includens]